MISRSVAFPVAVLLLLVSGRMSGEESSSYRSSEGQAQKELTGLIESVSKIRVRKGFGYIYSGGQNRGEMRLHMLAQRATREDAWLFVDRLWIDIGYEEQRKHVLCSWEATQLLDDFPADAKLIWYHIHPKRSDPKGLHPPSIENIFALSRLKALCEKNFGAQLMGKVFDGFGVWEVDLSYEVQRRLYPKNVSENQPRHDSYDPRDIAALMVSPKRRRELAWLVFYLNHERRAQEILQNRNMARDESIRRYLAAMADIGVSLEYTELD